MLNHSEECWVSVIFSPLVYMFVSVCLPSFISFPVVFSSSICLSAPSSCAVSEHVLFHSPPPPPRPFPPPSFRLHLPKKLTYLCPTNQSTTSFHARFSHPWRFRGEPHGN